VPPNDSLNLTTFAALSRRVGAAASLFIAICRHLRRLQVSLEALCILDSDPAPGVQSVRRWGLGAGVRRAAVPGPGGPWHTERGLNVNDLESLVDLVEVARQRYLAPVAKLSSEQGAFTLDADRWSIAQITKHLVHAEFGGINLIWRAAEGASRGAPVWTGESPNHGLNIEEVVQRTWRPRETSPDSALPRMGGPLAYWVGALRSASGLLRDLQSVLRGVALEDVIYPHAISGPLDARQRLQFLAFHLDRHHRQVAEIMSHPSFPKSADHSGRQSFTIPPTDGCAMQLRS
jgi:hypothetical protein